MTCFGCRYLTPETPEDGLLTLYRCSLTGEVKGIDCPDLGVIDPPGCPDWLQPGFAGAIP
jgi:hypothetical protein